MIIRLEAHRAREPDRRLQGAYRAAADRLHGGDSPEEDLLIVLSVLVGAYEDERRAAA